MADERHGRGESILRAAIEGSLAEGEDVRAAGDALRAYGAEVFGFLRAVVDDRCAAREAYDVVDARVTRELRDFRWRQSLRTWMYGLARCELARQRENRRPAQSSGDAAASSSVFAPGPYRRPIVGHVPARLLEGLAGEDRELLVLRVDRLLSWRDVALTSIGHASSERSLLDEAERSRRRFARMRIELLRRAARYGVFAR